MLRPLRIPQHRRRLTLLIRPILSTQEHLNSRAQFPDFIRRATTLDLPRQPRPLTLRAHISTFQTNSRRSTRHGAPALPCIDQHLLISGANIRCKITSLLLSSPQTITVQRHLFLRQGTPSSILSHRTTATIPVVQLCLVLVRTPITNHLAAPSSWRTIYDEFLSSTSPAEAEPFISFESQMECLLVKGLPSVNPRSELWIEMISAAALGRY